MFMVKCQVLFKEGYCKSTFIVLHRPPASDSVWPTEQLEIYKGFSAGTVGSETKENLICKQEILKAGICTKVLSLYSPQKQMKNYHMRVVIGILFRSHSSGNCILDHSILSSDECLVLVQLMTAGKFNLISFHFSPSSNTSQTNLKPKCCFPLVDLGGCAEEYMLLLQRLNQDISLTLSSLNVMILALPLQQLMCSQNTHNGCLLSVFICTASPVAGLLHSLAAALLHLLGEQLLPETRAIFFWQQIKLLTQTLKPSETFVGTLHLMHSC